MKLLVMDTGKVGLDVALRAQDAGHDVRLWVPRYAGGKPRRMGEGLVEKPTSWEGSMKWADIIIPTDNAFYINDLEPYFKKGFPIFGCNKAAGELELDREKGQKVMEDAGIKVLPFEKFTSYSKAIDFVKKTRKTYVSKPIGEADKGLSYVSKDAADMVFKLQRWSKSNTLKEGFILQECMKGTEMAVGGWVGPGGWSRWWCENWEEKRLMNGGLGINTGEQGTTLRYVKKSKMAQKCLEPVTDYLFSIDYVGYVDVNCIVSEEGIPFPLEFTMRFGWPLVMIQMALHQGDPLKWMVDLMEGRDTLKVSEDVAVGVVLSHGDYPYSWYPPEENTGFPLKGLSKKNKDKIHAVEVMLDTAPVFNGKEVVEDETLVTAGNYILVVVDTGESVTAASEGVYDTLKGLSLPNNFMYRTDIGERLEEELKVLQKHGFAEKMRF